MGGDRLRAGRARRAGNPPERADGSSRGVTHASLQPAATPSLGGPPERGHPRTV